MTELLHKQQDGEAPGVPRKRRWRYLIDMALPFFWFAYCFIPYWKSAEVSRLGWQVALPFFLSFEIPCVLIALRARNRWFRPERLPVRWPPGYPLQHQRLDRLNGLLWGVIVGCLAVAFFMVDRHETHGFVITLALCFCMSSIGASGALERYIKDRVYGGRPNAEPTGGWSGTVGRVHSDHWGGRPPAEGSQP